MMLNVMCKVENYKVTLEFENSHIECLGIKGVQEKLSLETMPSDF